MEQSFQIISIDTWERLDFFRFFDTFVDPNISITTDIECTGLISMAKQKGLSLYLVYTFILHKALNEVENLRYRMVGNEVRLYNFVDFEVYIQTEFHPLPRSVLLKWHSDFQEYYRYNNAVIAAVKRGEIDNLMLNAGEDAALVSSTPDLYFTAIKHATKERHNSSPLVNTGKIVKRGESEFMPVALTVTHAFVDGMHIRQFFDKIHSGFKSAVVDI